MVCSLTDVITYAKFQVEICRGYDSTGGGVKFPIFLLIFQWALQQCSATALPVIYVIANRSCNTTVTGSCWIAYYTIQNDPVIFPVIGTLVLSAANQNALAAFIAK